MKKMISFVILIPNYIKCATVYLGAELKIAAIHVLKYLSDQTHHRCWSKPSSSRRYWKNPRIV